jgi:hypothetical protein
MFGEGLGTDGRAEGGKKQVFHSRIQVAYC